MPLIDHTFFIGELNVPNTDKPEVFEELNRFIDINEKKFFIELLGYDLYTLFQAGIVADPVDQKWLNLLNGAEYQVSSRKYLFEGLVQGSVNGVSSLSGYNYKKPLLIQWGVTPGFPADVSTFTADGTNAKPNWIGWEIIPEKIGFGTQKKDVDYTYDKTTGVFALLGGQTFGNGEYWFNQFVLNENMQASVTSVVKKSPIANYVYYWWMRNKATETTGVGEAANKTDNATRVSPVRKMVNAWNEMVDMNFSIANFITINPTDYPSYTSNQAVLLNSNTWRGFNNIGSDIFNKINIYNL